MSKNEVKIDSTKQLNDFLVGLLNSIQNETITLTSAKTLVNAVDKINKNNANLLVYLSNKSASENVDFFENHS